MKYDLLVRGGTLVDPAWGRHGRFDLGITGGVVEEVAPELDPGRALRLLDVGGQLVFPGVIDSHVHVSTPDRWHGHAMMARAGVTTAVDFSGPMTETWKGLLERGTGLNVCGLEAIVPGENAAVDPGRAELIDLTAGIRARGGLGSKIIGGHRPASPEATAAIIAAANELGCYVAFHVGTTSTGSDLNGLVEAIRLAGPNHLHIAHVNSYCRGLTRPAVEEAGVALKALAEAPHLVSESYLGTINGTGGRCRGDEVQSHVTRNCLRMRGYSPDRQGLERALADGYALVNTVSGGEVVLLQGQAALQRWRERDTAVGLSFPVNDPLAMHALAVGKAAGRLVVDAISTDGGGIPRNVQVERGLALVRLGALTLEELVLKLALHPARMFGMTGKGHLGPGADADLTVVDPVRERAVLSVARGRLVMVGGVVVGSGGTALVTPEGAGHVRELGLPYQCVDLENSWFYRRDNQGGVQ